MSQKFLQYFGVHAIFDCSCSKSMPKCVQCKGGKIGKKLLNLLNFIIYFLLFQLRNFLKNVRKTVHGFHFQLELFFYALLFFTKHKNVIDRDIDVSLMIFSTYILPNLRCVNNHYSLFLFFL